MRILILRVAAFGGFRDQTVQFLERTTEQRRVCLQDVIDGDLCEQFPMLNAETQRKIAEELDRTPGEVLKKLEDIRNRII